MNKQASYISVATAVSLATIAVGGGMYVGALASDVETLEKAQVTAQEDHDRLIKVETEMTQVKATVAETRADVKLILQAVQRLETERED